MFRMAKEPTNFEHRGRFVGLWERRATELHDAARALWISGLHHFPREDGTADSHQMLYRPCQLLMGLSLEVALKASLVLRDPEKYVCDGEFSEKTHNISSLLEKAGVKLLDPPDSHLVRRLSAAVEWMAKYPIPVNERRLDNHPTELYIQNDGDFDRFERLWRLVTTRHNEEEARIKALKET